MLLSLNREARTMWDIGDFVADCRTAIDKNKSHQAVAEVVDRAMRNPAAVTQSLGVPIESGIVPIYKSSDLTIINVIWKPGMTIMPHNHEMWAVIGIYGGREDNIFWRRVKDDPDGRIEAAGARALSTGDSAPLGKDIIHSVTNPIPKLTGAIHIYGGDFFEAERSEWDSEALTEQAYDMSKVTAMFGE
jgi:predicted metal-dependent enzyme (double-stranded beta helix superfamily)